MSGATAARHAAPAPAGGAGGDVLPEAGERGSLTIAERVVSRVAGHAVTLVDGAVAAPRRVLGVNVGDVRPDERAHVDAQVFGSTATVDATIAVVWPRSVRSVADDVRRQVRDDVLRITGVQVDHVDLDVVALPSSVGTRRRVR